MRVQLLLCAIPLLAGGDSSCHNSNKDFLCEDLPIYISTYNKEDGRDHYYIKGDSNEKGLHVVKEKTHSKMLKTKKGSLAYWVQDQKGRYLEPHAGSLSVDLTNRGDEQGKWFLKYDTGNSNRFNIYTDVNKDAEYTVWSGGSRRRSPKNKNYLSYSDRGTDLKLLEEGNAGDRDWWFIDPAFCAVIDPDKVSGRWQWKRQVIHAGNDHEEHGYNLTIDATFHGEFSAKLKAVMGAGFHVGPIKGGKKIKAKLSLDLVADIDADIKTYKVEGYDVPWKDEDVNKHVWQWVMDLTDQGGSPSGDCGNKIPLLTSQFQLTKGDKDQASPCCIPGGFHDGLWDTCTSTDTLIPGNDKVCKVRKSQEEFAV